jgi:hypothetical protein
MTTKKSSTKKAARDTATDELDAFAHHLSEVLRIAATSDLIPVRFYNAVGEAWTEMQNTVSDATRLYDSEEYIRLHLWRYAEFVGEGGA